jgi:hypothetical protein
VTDIFVEVSWGREEGVRKGCQVNLKARDTQDKGPAKLSKLASLIDSARGEQSRATTA